MLQLLKNEEEIDYTPFLNFQSQLSILTDMLNFSFWVLESFINFQFSVAITYTSLINDPQDEVYTSLHKIEIVS